MKRIVNALGKLNWGERAAVAILLFVTAITSPAQTFTTILSFDGSNGADPGAVGGASLVQSTDGKLYGTTSAGGAYNGGTVFKITTSGKLTTLYSFDCPTSTDCPDGYSPSSLIQANNAAFYGVTSFGANFLACAYGCGTIFKITPAGKLTTLHTFSATDGYYPNGLTQATNGEFYGTAAGGANNGGIAFRMTAGGALTTLYNFCSQPNCADGSGPYGSLIQATDGNFYGTTWSGGTYGEGTVFKMTPAGNLTTLCSVEGYPSGTLVQATDGDFYGTTAQGGTIFRVTPRGRCTTLAVVGGFPYAGLVQGTDGNFYGTTQGGGVSPDPNCQSGGCGTVFEMTADGSTLTTLYNFCSQPNCGDGFSPLAGLVQDTNGNLYGTTVGGGATGDGTVFSLGVGLGPFLETRPTSGKVGVAVTILGTNLTGATNVAFNGTPATSFTVNSSGTAMTTTVPTGATTGPVQVKTPGGTLSSNAPFRVLP